MALSDCVECWSTPCECGHGYKDMTVDSRIKLAAVILGVDEVFLSNTIKSVVPHVHPSAQKK